MTAGALGGGHESQSASDMLCAETVPPSPSSSAASTTRCFAARTGQVIPSASTTRNGPSTPNRAAPTDPATGPAIGPPRLRIVVIRQRYGEDTAFADDRNGTPKASQPTVILAGRRALPDCPAARDEERAYGRAS